MMFGALKSQQEQAKTSMVGQPQDFEEESKQQARPSMNESMEDSQRDQLLIKDDPQNASQQEEVLDSGINGIAACHMIIYN